MRVGPLYFLDPDINLQRDPRWGRSQEVPGEDPYLTGEYGSYIIRGTQEGGPDARYMQAAGTMKHFQLYDYEGYQPNHGDAGMPPDASCDTDSPGPHCGRGTFDSFPPARDFAGYYMQAFKTVAQRAAPAAVMCAYNAIYGIPACASPINNASTHTVSSGSGYRYLWPMVFLTRLFAITGYREGRVGLGNSNLAVVHSAALILPYG